MDSKNEKPGGGEKRWSVHGAVDCDKEETDKLSGEHTRKVSNREQLPVILGGRIKAKRTI